MRSTRQQQTIVAIAGTLVLVSLGCYGASGDIQTLAPYRGHAVPPWWACVPATPLPTATPQPQPPGWTPTPGPDGALQAWDPPNWPPTPQPTPTPYVITGGEFWLNQNIWVPIHSYNHAAQHEFVGLSVKDWTPLGPSPSDPNESCILFYLNVWNYAGTALDIDVPNMIFLSSKQTTEVHGTSPEAFGDFGFGYPSSRLAAGETRSVRVPICKPSSAKGNPEEDHLRLGIVSSLYQSNAGTVGTNGRLETGADAAFYVNFWSYDPHCSYPPSQGLYPEFGSPPLGNANPIAGVVTRAMGGHYSEGAPVTIPPCLYITRGFGCSEFATGVSGAGRCPADMPYWHTGVDFSCYAGTPVYNVLDGYVRNWGDGGGYGNLVVIGNQLNTLKSYYAHLASFAAPQAGCFEEGNLANECHAGFLIGGVGTTGFSTGNHLHWEVRVMNVPIDPFLYFSQETPDGDSGFAQAWGAVPALAAPANADELGLLIQETKNVHPLEVRVRTPEGDPLSGLTLELSDVDMARVADCLVLDGACTFQLSRGPYYFRVVGDLPNGISVDPEGEINRQARENPLSEYHGGAIGIWHEGPATVAGIVIAGDPGFRQAQPYLDHTPLDEPTVLDPRSWMPEPAEGERVVVEGPPHAAKVLPDWMSIVLTMAVVLIAPGMLAVWRWLGLRRREGRAVDGVRRVGK